MSNEATFQSLSILLADASTAVIGLGNPDRSDDGIGVEMARQLKRRRPEHVFFEPEHNPEDVVLELLETERIRNVLFIDAVDFGDKPGAMKLSGAADAKRLLPAISTHQVPITLLMELLQAKGKQSRLFGIQPGSAALFSEMTDSVKQALDDFNKSVVDKIRIKGFS